MFYHIAQNQQEHPNNYVKQFSSFAMWKNIFLLPRNVETSEQILDVKRFSFLIQQSILTKNRVAR